MNIDEILDVIDELLDRSWSLPLSGGRCVVDADKVRDLIDDIRLNIPAEIKQAKAIVSDRTDIIENAKKEAEQIVRKAEDRARTLIAQEEVSKAAQAKASEILSQAQLKSREIRQAAQEFSDNWRSSSNPSPRSRRPGRRSATPPAGDLVDKERPGRIVRASFFAVIPRSPSGFSGRSRAGTWCVPPPARGASPASKSARRRGPSARRPR